MFGPICRTGGSSAQALFGVVEEWLRAGHELDFFSPGSYIDPERLVTWKNFRYTSVPLPSRVNLTDRAFGALVRSKQGPAILRTALSAGLNQARRVAHEGDLVARIRSEHAVRRYDAFLSMNRASTYTLGDAMPLVSWTQGPPKCESDFIRREGKTVRVECGLSGWVVLRAGYVIKDALAGSELQRSTGIITGSKWARAMWMRAGVPADRLAVLPFPVDVERFTARPRPADPGSFVFLWAGRIVPRKRLPLALEAFAKLHQRRPGARFLIAGGPGYQGLVPRYRLPRVGAGVEWLGSVPSSEMPALLARTDVVFQPSENENFGAAPVEGLACGIPSVIGPTNGTSDCLLDTAFRFESYTPEAIATALERAMDAVIADPGGIARRARTVAETISTRAIADQATRVIEGFIERWDAERGSVRASTHRETTSPALRPRSESPTR